MAEKIKKWQVTEMLYEKGWGGRHFNNSIFDTFKEAEKYMLQTNEKSNSMSLDWYVLADKPKAIYE